MRIIKYCIKPEFKFIKKQFQLREKKIFPKNLRDLKFPQKNMFLKSGLYEI